MLIFRFSALGDILMSVPVVDALARQYPEVKFVFVSRPFVESIMSLLPDNVSFVGVDLKQYQGIKGLNRLFRKLMELNPTHIADLHDVIRTQFLRVRFAMKGLPVSYIHKDRRQRRKFIRADKKTQQRTSFERYQDVFADLGFPVKMDFRQPFSLLPSAVVKENAIGIAPFAAHQGKIYPLEMMEKVVSILAKKTHVYLFGAGEDERLLMEQWAEKYPNVESVVGKLSNMAEELRLMSRLKLVLTMDSGNMHLASLAGIPVVSIWGATHPMGGFLGWSQSMDSVLQKEFSCRPCSIYGNKSCRFGDWRCLRSITPEEVVQAATLKLQTEIK